MSFILDALKKSEIDRQRQSVPGLMDTRLRERHNRLPVWAVVLAVLLGINLLVLTFVLMRNRAPAAHAARPAQAQTPSAPDAAAAPAAAEHFSPLDATPVYAQEIPVAAAGGAAASESPMTAPPITPRPTAPHSLLARSGTAGGPGKAPVRLEHRPDPLLTDEDAEANSQEILPSISEISLGGEQALPELHLDVHVYSTKPADRFVYINMRKYHEGAVLQEGPTVERIRRDGVVLNYQNLRFILPRQP